MTQLVIASNNRGKIKEIKALLAPFAVTVCSLKDIDLVSDVEETGTTFRENAALKAEAVAAKTGGWVLADDSGLCVDALDGAPGIYSARYSGAAKNDARNIDKLLAALTTVADGARQAHFICTLALAHPNQSTRFIEGRCDGMITRSRRGTIGFGYDPIFLIPELGQTFAEMSDSDKNAISHRGRALRQLAEHWQEWTGEAQ
ncbi:MAG: XTP/dITP diphosphatase [Sporolactobacillus sp.]